MFYEDYKELGIHLSDWLTTSFTINTSGLLKPSGNLRICGQNAETVATIKYEGMLSTDENTNPDVYKKIVFGKNSVLEIEAYGVLYVENNTMVEFERGATLVYHEGARIVLNGPNAILKFNESHLNLIGSNTIFRIESGPDGRGYVHFHKNWDVEEYASIYSEAGDNSRFVLEGDYTDRSLYYNDKILMVTGNIGIKTDWNLKEFSVRNGFVALGEGSKIISNAEYTSFTKCNLNTLENDEQSTYLHGGVEIPGRINNFDEVLISNANHGVSYYNRGHQGRLNIKGSYFNNCNVPVWQLGGEFK